MAEPSAMLGKVIRAVPLLPQAETHFDIPVMQILSQILIPNWQQFKHKMKALLVTCIPNLI
jgi:hypothetical protein